MKYVLIVIYDARTDDRGVGRETLVERGNDSIDWLDDRIVEVRSGVYKKLKYEMAKYDFYGM